MTNGGGDKQVTRFDLVSVSEQLYSRYRVYRYVLCAVAAIMIVTIAKTLVQDVIYGSGGFDWWLTLGVDVFLLIVVALVLWGVLFLFSPSVSSVEVSARSLILRYSRRQPVEIDWSDPTVKIRLRQFTPPLIGFSGPSRPDAFTLWGRWYKYNRITREVADGIIFAARDHGLQVRQKSSKGDGGTITRTIITPH